MVRKSVDEPGLVQFFGVVDQYRHVRNTSFHRMKEKDSLDLWSISERKSYEHVRLSTFLLLVKVCIAALKHIENPWQLIADSSMFFAHMLNINIYFLKVNVSL